MKHALMLDRKEAMNLISIFTIGRYVLFNQGLYDKVITDDTPPGVIATLIVLADCEDRAEFLMLKEEVLADRIQCNTQAITHMMNQFFKEYLHVEYDPG
jgi:hypothetical protein